MQAACTRRLRSTSTRYLIPVNTVRSSSHASPCWNRSNSSALLFAQACPVSSTKLDWLRSAAARYRNHVASGTRAANSAATLPMSSTIARNPPACNSRSVTRSASSSRVHVVPARGVGYFLSCADLYAARSCVFAPPAPQRTHNTRSSTTPAAAADSGSKTFDTSTHAATLPERVMPDRKECASDVRPLHSGPASSVMAPIGKPPSSTASTASMPVGATGRIDLGTGLSAAGIRVASAASICFRIAEADGIA